MKRVFAVIVSLMLLASGGVPQASAQGTAAQRPDDWPRTISSDGYVFKLYQPQADRWDGYTLRAHVVVAVQQGGDAGRLTYGVATISAKTIADREVRVVQLEGLNVEKVRFPSETDGGQKFFVLLRRELPLKMTSVPLEGLEADLAANNEKRKGRGYAINNTPPRIIFSQYPALLVSIDGEPAYAPVAGTALSRVINTQVLLLKDANGKFYLHVFDGYMEAPGLDRQWSVCRSVPADVTAAEKAVQEAGQVDLLEEGVADQEGDAEGKPSLQEAPAPLILVSFSPAELIVTQGEPDYRPIEGTDLLYMDNTSASVFRDLGDQKTYVLLAGRWFRAPSLNGPWEYVPAGSLPDDFARIPDDSEKEDAKASVPGTAQADEARIANEIPTTEKISRTVAAPAIELDGEPQLRPIAGTPLSYVFNCAVPVIRVDRKTWYAVHNGVWYVACDVRGPWIVAARVPSVIYSIPVNSPLHYVTYVRIYDATPQYVYCGYTPGYYGTVLSDDGIVVYGTGYVHPCYIGRHVWYGWGPTYGYGFSLCWTSRYGWSFGAGFGWGYHHQWYRPPRPYWGPYRFHHRFPSWGAGTALNVYHRDRSVSTRATVRTAPDWGAWGRKRFSGQTRRQTAASAQQSDHIYATRHGGVYRYERPARQWQRLDRPEKKRVRHDDEEYLERERTARESDGRWTHGVKTPGNAWGVRKGRGRRDQKEARMQ